MTMVRRHKDNAHYKTLKVDGYAALVRKALSDKDKYDESLEITIHMLACCLSRYAQIQTELDNSTLMLVSESREGKERYNYNPLFAMQEHMGEQIRKYLRELRLTKTGASAESEDAGTNELGKLFETINGGANAGPRLLKKSVTK